MQCMGAINAMCEQLVWFARFISLNKDVADLGIMISSMGIRRVPVNLLAGQDKKDL